MQIYTGNPVSPGIAMGEVLLYRPDASQAGGMRHCADAQESIEVYHTARKRAGEELQCLSEPPGSADKEQGDIFRGHLDILMDVVLDGEICGIIQEEGCQPGEAIRRVYTKYADIMLALDDTVMRERAADFQDVCRRLVRICAGHEACSLAVLQKPCIVVARELLPSDTAGLDREKVLAIVTEMGGETAHSAIIARSYGIPSVSGIGHATELVRQGQRALVDALQGKLVLEPDDDTIRDFRNRQRAYCRESEDARRYLAQPAETRDGQRISVMLNLATADERESDMEPYTDGVGLFRTEFLYLGRQHPPDEEQQRELYSAVLKRFDGRPVILRTLDIGGDKPLPYLDLPKEDNPFLGDRALRLCFRRPDLFRTQLRAALRASVDGQLWLMFPMVSSLEDFHRARAHVEFVRGELLGQGIPVARSIKLGVMIEIPALIFLGEELAEEVDFASIGSNDLCQYLLASDRTNPAVADYYQSYHPALFRAIAALAQGFERRGKPLGICGELGGDPAAAAVLIGLGLRKFSMGGEMVARLKRQIRHITVEEARKLAQEVLRLTTAEAVKAHLSRFSSAITGRQLS